jgi:hypothetical protein
MRQLRLVGQDDEGTSLVLETIDGTERFTLPNDERLRDATRVDLPRIGTIVNEATPLAPRDIQIRVRSGEDPQVLADEAGLALERIMRFAYPVLAERVRVTDEARRGRARRSSEGQLVPFGELADTRFAAHGVDPSAVAWDAFRREDGGWTVTATTSVDEKPLLAKFSFALMTRTVSALNDVAADLLSDRPIRALAPPQPPPVLGPDAEPAGPVRLTAVPDPTDTAIAEPSGATVIRVPSKRQKAHTHPLPLALDDELFDQEALDDPWHEQELPLDLGEQTPAPAESSIAQGTAPDEEHDQPKRSRRAGEKPRMPSWDDILLGVRHKTD